MKNILALTVLFSLLNILPKDSVSSTSSEGRREEYRQNVKRFYSLLDEENEKCILAISKYNVLMTEYTEKIKNIIEAPQGAKVDPEDEIKKTTSDFVSKINRELMSEALIADAYMAIIALKKQQAVCNKEPDFLLIGQCQKSKLTLFKSQELVRQLFN